MGKLKGFIEYDRTDEKYLSVTERLKNYKEFTITPHESEMVEQGGRCMDCGGPSKLMTMNISKAVFIQSC